jgi:hypothetical protein
MTLRIRTSERRSFKRCRKRWEYEYIELLKPKSRNSALWVGDYVHRALAVYYGPGSQVHAHAAREFMGRYEFTSRADLGYNKMEEEERQRLNDDIALAQGMLEHYFVWAPDNDDFEVREVEFYAEIPVGKDTVVTLRADALMENDEGHWLLEHKTTSGIDADAIWLEIDDQATTYTWAFQQLATGRGNVRVGTEEVPVSNWQDIPQIKGMLYNFLNKQVPHDPELTQKGIPSRASVNLTCTPDAYRQALRAVKPSMYPLPQEYSEFLTKLDAKRWFHRLPVYRGSDELAGFEELLLAEVAEIERARKHPLVRYRVPTRDCSWECPFLDVCKGELEGLDMDFTKTEKFDKEEQLALPGG